MAESSREIADNAASPDELLEYNKALNANVSNFVKVKLSGRENYKLWRAQMMCLADVYNIDKRIFISYRGAWPSSMSSAIAEQYDKLLKGWIIGSIDQGVLERVSHISNALIIFLELADLYATRTFTELPTKDRMLINVSPNENENEDKKKLLNATMEGSWWKAKAIIKKQSTAATMEINDNGDTMEGSWWKAKAILKKQSTAATMEINDNGDTMLHLAVKEGKNYFVKQLLNFIEDGSEIVKRNSAGYTALHIAAIVDNKQAAELLVSKNDNLLDGRLPLSLACTNGQIKTFLYLVDVVVNRGSQRHFFPPFNNHLFDVAHLLAIATSTKQYNLALKLVEIPELRALVAQDYKALLALTTDFPRELGFWEELIYPSSDGVRQNIVKRRSLLLNSFENLYIKAHDILWAIINPQNTYLRWLLLFVMLILFVPVAVFCLIYLVIYIVIFVLLLPLFMLYPHLWKGLVYAGLPIKHIEKKKRDYREAIEVLELICKEMNKKKLTQDAYVKLYEQPILEAARVDACEVVVQILRSFDDAQEFNDERRHNVFQLAILNRSEKIYNRLSPGIKASERLRTICDGSRNSLTHLAAKLASSNVISRTTGAALQLQQELQWHEEVKKLMRPIELTWKNRNMDTSEMVFTKEHADLLKEGEEWMKTTAEACSITAALIVTIVFAAAITVPGGSNQETGIPLFKKEIAFTVFAVCDALSLFTAATALLIFLSILTTRFAAKDFLVSLPRRLILGLCALFISTTAMMVAFGAILLLVFCDQRPWMLAPIGLFTCMPILAIVTLQLPLLVDLFQSTYISRFN